MQTCCREGPPSDDRIGGLRGDGLLHVELKVVPTHGHFHPESSPRIHRHSGFPQAVDQSIGQGLAAPVPRDHRDGVVGEGNRWIRGHFHVDFRPASGNRENTEE